MDTRLMQKAKRHLSKVDPVLKRIIAEVGEPKQRVENDPFRKLVRSIIGQQISVKAAQSIWARLGKGLRGGTTSRKLKPDHVLSVGHKRLRSYGLSNSKALSIRDLAERCEGGEIGAAKLVNLSDEEVRGVLTQIRGIGPWTAEMYLMFGLGRPDILPVDDIGLWRAVKNAYGLKKYPSRERLSKMAKPWAPYRSVATRYLWDWLDNTVEM